MKREIWGSGRGELSEAGGLSQTYDCIQIKTHPTMHLCPTLLCTYGWTKKSSAHASANRIIFLPPVIVSHVFTMPLCINMSVSTSGNPQRKNHMLILILSNNEKAKSWSLNSHKAQRDSRAWKERVVNLKRHPERTRIMRVKCEWFRPFSITFAEKKTSSIFLQKKENRRSEAMKQVQLPCRL